MKNIGSGFSGVVLGCCFIVWICLLADTNEKVEKINDKLSTLEELEASNEERLFRIEEKLGLHGRFVWNDDKNLNKR